MSKLTAKSEQKKWRIKAPLGLLLIGFGSCLVAEAAILKYSGADWLSWVLYGTLALIVLNSGLCIFGDAVKHRSHFERLREEESA